MALFILALWFVSLSIPTDSAVANGQVDAAAEAVGMLERTYMLGGEVAEALYEKIFELHAASSSNSSSRQMPWALVTNSTISSPEGSWSLK